MEFDASVKLRADLSSAQRDARDGFEKEVY